MIGAICAIYSFEYEYKKAEETGIEKLGVDTIYES